MRIGLIIAGVVLVVAGVAAFFGKIEYPHEKEVAKIGGISATVTHDQSVPQWIGAVAALLGVGLLFAGARKS